MTGRPWPCGQAKTKTQVWVPALPELRRLLDATPRASVKIVVSERTNRPYAESDFLHTFAEIRAAAGLPIDLQFRDLRRTLRPPSAPPAAPTTRSAA